MRIVDQAAEQVGGLQRPSEGWLVKLRKALGMSGSDVASRMGVSRAAIYQAERNERDGAITINQMQKIAEAMGGRFVYAVIPEGSVHEVIRDQARRKARERVRRASAQMALEEQSLSETLIEERIDDLADELARDFPSGFWRVR